VPGEPPRLLLITSDWPAPVIRPPAQPNPPTLLKRHAEALQSLGLSVEIFAFRGRGVYNLAAAWTRVRPRLHRGRYDVVHALHPTEALLTLPKRVPLVVTIDRLDLGARFLARRADAVVVQSAELGRALRTRAAVCVQPEGLDAAARAAWLADVYRSVASS
jgi:hypothetical protein